MKRKVILALLLAAGFCMLLLLTCVPAGRLWKLQRLGHVPESSSWMTIDGGLDWYWAEWTTWWGKPIDPKEFWKDRVIWNDSSATLAAEGYGREYPPIPVNVPNLTVGFPLGSRSHKDIVPGPWSGGLDGGSVKPYHYTDAESAYWNWFWRTKPKPPETLEHEQFKVADTILTLRKLDKNNRYRASDEDRAKSRAQEVGMPVEALSENALFWAYVMAKRHEYDKQLAQAAMFKLKDDSFVRSFLDWLAVDAKFITEPLTAEQIKGANAWKVAYLQRIRREHVDESYINAYLKTWGMSAAEVFQ